MKKIIAGAALAALSAGLVFADGPVANLAVTDFTGNAKVEWGADLDAGKTGFKNAEYMKFVINLFDAGEKKTEQNGDIWAELVMKAGNIKDWTHRLFQYDAETAYTADGYASGLNDTNISFDIDTAKLHFGDFYVGIQNGDTQVGEYKFDGAIRGPDYWKGQSKWLFNVGPNGFTQGIVAGYGNNNFGVDVDFRSFRNETTQYTNAYAMAAEAKLKDSNEFASGLAVDAGVGFNLSSEYYTKGKNGEAVKNLFGTPSSKTSYSGTEPSKEQKELAAKTLEAAVDEGKSVVEWEAAKKAVYDYNKSATTTTVAMKDAKTIGYNANASYKFKIDDKSWLKPAVGFTGTTASGKLGDDKVSNTSMDLVAGVMYGWGSTGDDAGLYYLDGDMAKNATPGVSVTAKIPLASSWTNGSNSGKNYGKTLAVIVPSFYTKNDVEGLTAAVYSEMAILRDKVPENPGKDSYAAAADKDQTFAMAVAAAAKYDIKADAVTVTPQVGFRFANTAWGDNIDALNFAPLNIESVFANMGVQAKETEGKRKDLLKAGFFNLKAGVNANGLINNTDLYVIYESANLLNQTDYSKFKDAEGNTQKFYNAKAGTLTVGCKISL